MTMKERMEAGLLYHPGDAEILSYQMKCLDRLFMFNQIPPSRQEEKTAMLREMFAEIGENCYIETPLRANFGGAHVHFGKSVYANFNLTLVDDADIYVGDNVMFGPNVTVITASHPILPELRKKEYQFNRPVHIGRNCWIGAGAIILPGVTVGENTVVGAGSVVTKDLPQDVVAVGNPARVLRKIDENDRVFFCKGKTIDWENLV